MRSVSPGAARAGRRLFQVAVVAGVTALAVQRYLARGVDRPAEFTGALVAAGLFAVRALADAAGLGSRVRFRGIDMIIESLGFVLAGQILSDSETAPALAEALLVIGLVVGFVVGEEAGRPVEG